MAAAPASTEPDPLAALLPESMAEVCKLIGPSAMMALLDNYAGTRLHVPKRLHAGAELASVLRFKPAKRLADEYGGSVIHIGMCREWRATVLRGQGHSFAQIARRIGMREDSVHKLISAQTAKRPDALRTRILAAQLKLPFV